MKGGACLIVANEIPAARHTCVCNWHPAGCRGEREQFGEWSLNHGALESSQCNVASEQLPEGLPGNRNSSHEYGWLLIMFVYV